MANLKSEDTIFTFNNRAVQSEWSEVWSTGHIPALDNASGGAGGAKGRRKLRLGSLALGAFLTMHCRVSASALTGGFFVFMLFLILATVALANPLRHFEVYLGQWSISGPGRAFRVLPLFEGLGIAICINALVRAIICCTIAAITAIYVTHSVADLKLPSTYCRDFDLKPYDPILKEINLLMLRESRFSLATGKLAEDDTDIDTRRVSVGTQDFAWRNSSPKNIKRRQMTNLTKRNPAQVIEVCKENYTIGYPILYSTPAYNFFYVEVVLFRDDYNFGQFNMPLVLCIILIWGVLWLLLIIEHLKHGKLMWNNMSSWFVVIPWIWAALLLITAIINLVSLPKALRNVFKVGAKEVVAGMADALEVALYIHSASVGTEIIHGKGLNHFASGHIDPHLGGENVWHSGLLLLMCALTASGAAVCAVVDCVQPHATNRLYDMNESTLWIIPMYSKCTLVHNYSHLLSVLIFSGLTFSYITVAFVLVKTSLHTIFEYKVKLVFAEQIVVAGIILSCMGLSLLFATTGGVALLESVDAVTTGVATPLVCLLELVALMYVYRSRDFVSDMNVATEDNACASRIGTQWQMIPAITLLTLIMKLSVLCSAEMPGALLWAAAAVAAAVAVAAPIRAARNLYSFLRRDRPAQR